MRPGKLSLDEPWVQGPGGVGELREHAEAATRLPSGPAMGQECGVCEEVKSRRVLGRVAGIRSICFRRPWAQSHSRTSGCAEHDASTNKDEQQGRACHLLALASLKKRTAFICDMSSPQALRRPLALGTGPPWPVLTKYSRKRTWPCGA